MPEPAPWQRENVTPSAHTTAIPNRALPSLRTVTPTGNGGGRRAPPRRSPNASRDYPAHTQTLSPLGTAFRGRTATLPTPVACRSPTPFPTASGRRRLPHLLRDATVTPPLPSWETAFRAAAPRTEPRFPPPCPDIRFPSPKRSPSSSETRDPPPVDPFSFRLTAANPSSQTATTTATRIPGGNFVAFA